jgi:hypothetical protein
MRSAFREDRLLRVYVWRSFANEEKKALRLKAKEATVSKVLKAVEDAKEKVMR